MRQYQSTSEPAAPANTASATPAMARAREAVLQRELARLLRQLAANQDHLTRLDAEIDAKNRNLDWLARQLAERDQLIANLHASHSWRLTAPIRSLSHRLRKIVRLQKTIRLRRPPPSVPAGASDAAPAMAPPPAIPALPSGGPVMLIISDHLPLYDQQSGGLRLKTLIGLIGEAGLRMVHASMFGPDFQPGILGNPEARARYQAALGALGVTDFLFGPEQIDGYLKANGNGLAWVVIVFPDTMHKMLAPVRSYCPGARVVYDMVDFHGLRMRREAELRRDAALRDQAERQFKAEIAAARAADVTIAITEDERAAMLQAAPDVVVEVLPNIFEMPERQFPEPSARRDLLFVGGFWHRPNGDAMLWFANEIFPIIQAEIPDIVLRIVGANAENEVLALGARPGIEILGYVPRLDPLFDRHRVFVAPLRYGAGMKGKVGQSLIHSLPVVATTIGAEGMGLIPGQHLLVADDPAEFAAEVLRLLRDDALWSRLAANGRAHIAATLSIEAVRPRVKELFGG